MNMFANLQLESGRSNHLVLGNSPGPFQYLDDVVEIIEVSGASRLIQIKDRGLHVTYYGLLDELDRNTNAKVSFKRRGHEYFDQSAQTLHKDIEAIAGDQRARKLFYVEEVRKIQTSLVNDTLIVTNTGNIPYKGPIEIIIGSAVEGQRPRPAGTAGGCRACPAPIPRLGTRSPTPAARGSQQTPGPG